MGFYRLIFFYRFGEKGWTETYYRWADSGRSATSFAAAGIGAAEFVDWRGAGVTLQAVRAQEVDGLRRIYLRWVGWTSEGDSPAPAVPSQAAYCWVPFFGGEGRALYLRGLPDYYVKRNAAGVDSPHPHFFEDLARLNEQFHLLGFRGRRKIQSHPKTQVLRYGPSAAGADFTDVVCRGSPGLAAGQYCELLGPPTIGIRTQRGYIVAGVDGDTVTVIHPWQQAVREQLARQPAWIRRREYEYPAFEPAVFRSFTTRQVGPRYRLASWHAAGRLRVPLSPCGRGVDMLKQCYRVPCSFFRDDPQLQSPITWYWLDEDLQAFGDLGNPSSQGISLSRGMVPYDHPFGSRDLELQDDYPPLLGEAWTGRTWYGGQAPVELYGVGLCGSVSQWNNGADTSDPVRPLNATTGAPCCCGPGALQLAGDGAGEGDFEAMALTSDCTNCPDGAAASWELTFAGVTGDFAFLNQTWVIPHVMTCFWDLDTGFTIPDEFGGDPLPVRLRIQRYNLSTWRVIVLLLPSFNVAKLWEKISSPTSDCLECFTATRAGPAETYNWPASLTVCPY